MRQVFAAAGLFLLLIPGPSRAQGPFKEPKTFPPDAESLRQITTKTEQLQKAVESLKNKIPDDVFVEVAIYLKAAENIIRFKEWLHANSVKWTFQTLEEGLERAKLAEDGKAVWRDAPGKWINRAYRSHIDNSIQPYAVLLPHDYGKDPKKKWRLDVVLHGRDGALTEAKFLATHGKTAKEAPKELGYVQLEPYGRGNNAYRWAGEKDVFEAMNEFSTWRKGETERIDQNRVVLRGFSMGGAGTWHIGLHFPSRFCVIGPGAGFTTTRGYIANLPTKLPDYQEKCLRIYDAVGYTENVFNVPVVAYSGEKDSQKKAADNIENALKGFKEPVQFTHLIAPGLAHQMPPEWQAKAEAEYRKYTDTGRAPMAERVRFVTYTPRYGFCDWVLVEALEHTYEKAIVDATRKGATIDVRTSNVRRFGLIDRQNREISATVDSQKIEFQSSLIILDKVDGKWVGTGFTLNPFGRDPKPFPGIKTSAQSGPIDDAFMSRYTIVGPDRAGWYEGPDNYAAAELAQFGKVWDRYFRAKLPTFNNLVYGKEYRVTEAIPGNLVLFGDPQSNPLIRKVLPDLPITWTQGKLVVNTIEYDPKTHIPLMIYPCRYHHSSYVVLNTGHTFREADLKGTNALLYPRLGDWAVIKPTPTKKDPAAYEVVAAGLFDENWQFTGPVADGAKLEKLWSEGEFTEGPAEGPDGCIYFSDIGNRIMKFDPTTGKTTEFRKPSGRSNGLKFDAKGRLVACEGANTGGLRRISITEKDGTVKTLADKFDGKKFNSPNDLTIDSKGRIYFSDPRYVGDEKRELDHESVYRVDPDGTVTLIATPVAKPNGLVISPDGKTLYVSEHGTDEPEARSRKGLIAYSLKEDGTVGKGKWLFDFGKARGIDGMTVRADGVIVAAAGSKDAAGIYYFSPEGKKLAFLKTPEDPSNCCFAGPESKTLYITAGKSLYRVELTVAGK